MYGQPGETLFYVDQIMSKINSKLERFPREKLLLKPLSERDNLLDLSIMEDPGNHAVIEDPRYLELASRIVSSREKNSAVLALMGAHVIRAGMSPLIIRLMEEGLLTHIGFNGAGAIHDFEFALIGQTTESVARYIQSGEFGLWKETGILNDIVKSGVDHGLGYGEAVGKYILENDLDL